MTHQRTKNLRKVNFIKIAHIRKIHSRPASQGTRPATVRRIRIQEMTSNITVS